MSEEVEQVLLRYEAVETLLFSVRQLTQQYPSAGVLGFEIQSTIDTIAPNTDIVAITLEVVLKEPDLTEPLARVIARHKFQLQGIERFKRDGEYHIPASLIAELLSTTYETTRGIALARGAGTIVETLVLPLLDSEEMIRHYTKTEEGTIVIKSESTTA